MSGDTEVDQTADVVVIGAGPSGATASAMLANKGYQVLALERETFPRFSIGESLLPYSMAVLAEAGLLNAVENAGFQIKDGAAFYFDEKHGAFNFSEKTSSGPGTAFQVQRAQFDELLANEAARKGADIRFGHQVNEVLPGATTVRVCYSDSDGDERAVNARFLLDASGFGRVLPRLLNLEKRSELSDRVSLFTHVSGNLTHPAFDHRKILIAVHPKYKGIWYWVIPFSDGTSSIGVVGSSDHFASPTESDDETLRRLISEVPYLATLLDDSTYKLPVRKLRGYSSSVTSLVGPNYALLGNAGEFLDPVFSSGVTIALKSASLAAGLVDRQLQGGAVDWVQEYEVPLRKGVDVFRVFVNAWYDLRLQHIIFHPRQSADVKAMICSILAGYAWDADNPYVVACERRINVLAEICKPKDC